MKHIEPVRKVYTFKEGSLRYQFCKLVQNQILYTSRVNFVYGRLKTVYSVLNPNLFIWGIFVGSVYVKDQGSFRKVDLLRIKERRSVLPTLVFRTRRTDRRPFWSDCILSETTDKGKGFDNDTYGFRSFVTRFIVYGSQFNGLSPVTTRFRPRRPFLFLKGSI